MPYLLEDALGNIPEPMPAATTAQKRQFSDDLSREFTLSLSRAMTSHFPEAVSGGGNGVMAATAAGLKSVDIGYHVLGAGLALGVSVKCIGLPEEGRGYTHNYKRVGEEWTLETISYHRYQPYSIMVGVLFLPSDALLDRVQKTSFVGAVEHFQRMSGRASQHFDPEIMEQIFIGVYEPHGAERAGDVFFVNVDIEIGSRDLPPDAERLSFEALKSQLVREFRTRNPRLRVAGMP